jgi:hypothetical protein
MMPIRSHLILPATLAFGGSAGLDPALAMERGRNQVETSTATPKIVLLFEGALP